MFLNNVLQATAYTFILYIISYLSFVMCYASNLQASLGQKIRDLQEQLDVHMQREVIHDFI